MKISIHTIFVLRENILFLEEWIDYHLKIGIDKIFLYDNSASKGRNGSSVTTNKYGINFSNITMDLNDIEIHDRLRSILAKYQKKVFYMLWEPRNMSGEVVYGQKNAVCHYFRCFGIESNWTAFIDMDEFIFCKNDLRQSVEILDKQNIGNIRLLQKKFDDRFNNIGIPVTKISRCINGIDTSNWAPKSIIKNDLFDFKVEDFGIHNIPTRQSMTFQPPIEEFRFNHYNVNDKMLDWARNYFHNTDICLNANCYELYGQGHKTTL